MSIGTAQERYRARPQSVNLGDQFVRDWGGLVLGALAVGLPVVLHLFSPPLAVLTCAVLAFMVAIFATPFAPVVLVFSYLFQNLFVAFVSPALSSADQLDAIRAYNFLITAVVWLVLYVGYWLERPQVDVRMRRLIDFTTVALLLIALYFCLGAISDPIPAVVYLRNVATPFFLIQIFALVGYRTKVEFVRPLFIMALLALAYGYTEMFFQEGFYKLTNGEAYLKLGVQKAFESGDFLDTMYKTGEVFRGYLDKMQVGLFNTPLLSDFNITVSRVLGPNFHSISFAYFLVGASIVLLAAGRWVLPIVAIPLILIVGSKGAFVLFALGGMALFLTRYMPVSRAYWFYIFLLTIYACLGVIVGMRMSDYHVIGFIGGIRGFLSNPLGHGLGAGGNLVTGDEPRDWGAAQQSGYTDVGVESAIGVLLYQVGLATFVLVPVLFWISRSVWRHYLTTLQPIFVAVSLGLATVTFNGIFQEEALFAPLAGGFFAGLAGLLLGSFYGEVPEAAPPPSPRKLRTPRLAPRLAKQASMHGAA